MRVLHVIPAIAPRYGGPSYAIGALAKGLMERDVEVVIATTDADGPGRLAVPWGEAIRWKGIPIRYFPRQCSEAFKYSRPLARWLREHVDDFDLVHIHGVFSHSSVAAYKACRANGVPYVVRPLGTLDPSTIRQKAVRKRLFSMAWGKSMLSHAAGIHYSTGRERALVEGSLGLGSGFVLPIGISMEPVRACEGQEVLDHSRVCGQADAQIVYVGRLDAIKNLELLIDVFDVVTRCGECCGWHLTIAGDGDSKYVSRLKGRARSTGAAKRIHFPGWLDESRKRHAVVNAELFASFSLHESFGRSVVEAMSLGVPVLISDEIFIADEVRRYKAGWVASGSFDEIAGILRKAISDPHERRKRGAAARQLVFEQLDLNRSAEQMARLYETIIAAGGCLGCQPI